MRPSLREYAIVEPFEIDVAYRTPEEFRSYALAEIE
jgi:hypothetical protein